MPEQNGQDWKFTFTSFLAGANAQVTDHMTWAESQREIITNEEIELRSDEAGTISKQLYLALSLQVKNEALTKVKNVDGQNGLEAWRKLVE